VYKLTGSSNAGVAVEPGETEFALRSGSVLSTLADARVAVTSGRFVVVTETANTRVQRTAEHRRARVTYRAVLAELTLFTVRTRTVHDFNDI